MVKLGTITERADLDHDPSWAETGDRYLLKIFRDWVRWPQPLYHALR